MFTRRPRRRAPIGPTGRSGTGPLQHQADGSDAVRGLAALQRKADARAPLQRKVSITKDGDPSLNITHSNTRKSYVKTPLITALEQEFKTVGSEPAFGWKAAVWEMERDQQTTHSYDTLADFASELIDDRPRKSGSKQPEDPAFRANIEKHVSQGGTKPYRQAWGTHNLAVSGQAQDQQQFLTDLQQPQNRQGFIDSTRQGRLNETLLTSQSDQAAMRSMGQMQGIEATAPTRSGGQHSWMSAQWQTSAPTDYFAFKNTTKTPSGKIQDTHINAQTYIEDAQGKKHMTVGGTSHDYHLGNNNSLASIFDESTRILSWARRNAKLHNSYLARGHDIVAVLANQRTQQYYETSWGKRLDLSKPSDLQLFAQIVEVHRSKILTMLKTFEQEILPTGYESESSVDYDKMDFETIGLDENTQDHME